MELADVVNTQFAFHGVVVGCVLLFAALVFVFGFKSVEAPFDRITNPLDDRKPAGKKRKLKDKKSQANGHATAVSNDRAELKQKGTEGALAKGNSFKSAVKQEKREVEKSPTKELSIKVSQKQAKPEPSPAKPALKESKGNKENKKSAEKSLEKSTSKENNQTGINRAQIKAMGKENVGVEFKNKKNAKKNIGDEKPKDFDDGGWQAVLHKKTRKPTANEDEVIMDKSVTKKEVGSPKKSKKAKPVDVAALAVSEPVVVPTPETVSEVKDPKSETKPLRKEKEPKKEKPKVTEPAFEVVLSQASVEGSSDSDSKTAKKKKKKAAATAAEVAAEEKAAVAPDKAAVAPDKAAEEPTMPIQEKAETIGPAKANKEPPSQVVAKTVPEVDDKLVSEVTVVFDEIGDTSKETKGPKRATKKKVRRDQ